MGLFQKKPQVGSQVPLYTTGLQQTKLIIGLGNPGAKYDGTRHNIGFACLDAFAKAYDLGNWREQKDLKCQVATGAVGDIRVILAKPQTFMNLSGEGAVKIAQFYKIPAQDIIAVYDELDIAFGQIRARSGGSAAGHNGVKSLIQHFGEDFGRIRIGIKSSAQGRQPAADFVLAKFSEDEQKDLPDIIREVVSLIDEVIHAAPFPSETRTVVIPGL